MELCFSYTYMNLKRTIVLNVSGSNLWHICYCCVEPLVWNTLWESLDQTAALAVQTKLYSNTTRNSTTHETCQSPSRLCSSRLSSVNQKVLKSV